jgi:hypothetical protein
MDAFEAARLKHAKNLERKLRTTQHQPIEDVGRIEPEVLPEVPRTKPKHEAIIEVKVRLPDNEIVVMLMKPHVYENAIKSRLNKSEIKKCVENGFAPLLGRLHDVSGGR